MLFGAHCKPVNSLILEVGIGLFLKGILLFINVLIWLLSGSCVDDLTDGILFLLLSMKNLSH